MINVLSMEKIQTKNQFKQNKKQILKQKQAKKMKTKHRRTRKNTCIVSDLYTECYWRELSWSYTRLVYNRSDSRSSCTGPGDGDGGQSSCS